MPGGTSDDPLALTATPTVAPAGTSNANGEISTRRPSTSSPVAVFASGP
jgi:hypothetical protein